jgi:hypothetical protein
VTRIEIERDSEKGIEDEMRRVFPVSRLPASPSVSVSMEMEIRSS